MRRTDESKSGMQKNLAPEQDVKTLGEVLEGVIAKLPGGDETVALGTVLELMERDGFLLICVFLALPCLVPVTIPGSGLVLGLFVLLIGISVMFNTDPHLPRRLLGRRYPAEKLRKVLERGLVWVHRIEKLSRPRLLVLTRGPVMERFNGFMIALGGLLLVAPFPGVVPLTNTLPGWIVFFVAIGMLQCDGICLLLGYITAVVNITYFALLVVAGVVGLDKLWQVIERLLAG